MTKNRRRKQDARRLAGDSGMSYIQALREAQLTAALHGIPTPLPTLSGYLNGGWQPGQLITVGARPGVGKSIFAANAAVAAVRAERSVLWFSLEQTRSELSRRLHPLVEGLSPVVSRKVSIAIEDSYNQTVESIRARALEARETEYGLDLMLIDGLQLIAPPSGFNSRSEAISSITLELKRLAQELQIPVILFSQLNRGGGMSLSALGSSAVAQDSDVVILLDRENYQGGALSVRLEKNRSGESHRIIHGYIDPESQKIRDLTVERSARTNPILRQWAEELFSGELTLSLLLAGWTVDGPGATSAQKDEARAEMLAFEARFTELVREDGLSYADEPLRSVFESWAGRPMNVSEPLPGDRVEDTVVWELGEHGGYWFVEGTTDRMVALHALQLWLIETDPEHANDCREMDISIRDDWYWEPREGEPDFDGEAELRSVAKHGPSEGKDLMRGVFIQSL